MSDSYITIVPETVTSAHIGELSQRAIDLLVRREIISKNPSDCVLGKRKGYPPGPKYKDIIEGYDFGLLGLKVNGLEVVTERQVFDSGENELEKINCPNCGANNIDSDWGETIGAWDGGQNSKLKCNHCDQESSITDYDFKPTWGFGEFGLTFWNWPRLTPEFMDDLRKLFDRDVKIIYGRR